MQSREHISFLRRALSESALRQSSAKLSPHTFWICAAGLNRQVWTIRFEKLTALFFTRWYRENAAWRQADTFATFWNDKETGAEMCPAIASGIVTEDALVSYWPMLLAIITICTRAQLHSKTISGFACVASVSVRFLSRESKTARPLHSLSYDLYSVLGQPKSIKKFFPGYYIQSWRKFKLFSRKKGIQGLFKTVRTLF